MEIQFEFCGTAGMSTSPAISWWVFQLGEGRGTEWSAQGCCAHWNGDSSEGWGSWGAPCVDDLWDGEQGAAPELWHHLVGLAGLGTAPGHGWGGMLKPWVI